MWTGPRRFGPASRRGSNSSTQSSTGTPGGRTARHGAPSVRSAASAVLLAVLQLVLRVVDLDALLAHLVGDRAVLRDGLGAQPHPFDGLDVLVDDRPLGVQRDLLLLLTDLRAVAAGAVPDRLALHADLLVADRHG